MKKLLKGVLFLVICTCFMMDSKAFYEYTIEDYDIELRVNIDNTIDINEKIGVNFDRYKHGIFRKIPFKNEVNRLDGTSSLIRARVLDINVLNEQYTTYTEGDYKVIKIGDPYKTIIGEKEYNITYRYDLGKDKSKKYDELYFNIVGTEWDTTIDGLDFTIEMPKTFDEKELGFSTGEKGSVNNENISYRVIGNQIIGSYNKTLEPGEAVTVRLELPDGYFEVPEKTLSTTQLMYALIPALLACLSLLIWKKYGDDPDVVATVEFYPPKGLNSLEVGYIYSGTPESSDVTSLVVYLANKGYLEIIELPKKNKYDRNNFKFRKLKDYDGDNENERLFLEGLFTKKSLFKEDEYVTEIEPKDLQNKFYKVMKKIHKNIIGEKFGEKYFTKGEKFKKGIILFFFVISICLMNIPAMLDYGVAIPDMLFALMEFVVSYIFICGYLEMCVKEGFKKAHFYILLLIVLPFIGYLFIYPFITIVYEAIIMETMYVLGYLVGLVSIIIMITCSSSMMKRTNEGHVLYEQIIGFRDFLDLVEVEKLESLVHQNPNYFYDILPYTYVLDLSTEWIDKFETIVSEPPRWYHGSSFDFVAFNSFMDSTVAATNSTLSSSPGGGSGGGSSGGGSGGGGGGSW